ncbi:MAG: hypothetical protein RL417_954 [Pseudomonadota bacterium]|jgi:hypothetical protein
MFRFEDRRPDDPAPYSGKRLEDFSAQTFHQDLSGFRADKGIVAAIDDLFDNPEGYPFERVKAFAEFLKGERFRTGFPGAARSDLLFLVDPQPIELCGTRVFQGYRLNVLRSTFDRGIIIGTVFRPDYIQLENGGRLTEELARSLVDGKRIVDWSIRIPCEGDIAIDRRVIAHRWFGVRDAERPGSDRFTGATALRIGTTRSLGVVNIPGRILMYEFRGSGASEIELVTGLWRNQLSVYADGLHLIAEFTKTPGFFRDRSIAVRNTGDVPFRLRFEDLRARS